MVVRGMNTGLRPVRLEKSTGDAPNNQVQRDRSKGSTIRALSQIVALQHIAIAFDIHHALNQLQVRLIGMPGHYQIIDPQRRSPMPFGDHQHLISRLQQRFHRRSHHSNARSAANHPLQKFHCMDSGQWFHERRGQRLIHSMRIVLDSGKFKPIQTHSNKREPRQRRSIKQVQGMHFRGHAPIVSQRGAPIACL